ncbi:MAG: hypothetical protein JWO80_6453 [Bryobacterales bacterium]|nr:hypothetical protein [Bryobacterales bacterium]
MNRTIYIRDEDVPTWERAREIAGEKLSPVIMDGLKAFVARKEAEVKGFERIEVHYNDAEANGLPRIKAFNGKWIMGPKKPEILNLLGFDTHFCVAVTAKGGVVILFWSEEGDYTEVDKTFQVYESFDAAAQNDEVAGAAIFALERIGVAVEELDI